MLGETPRNHLAFFAWCLGYVEQPDPELARVYEWTSRRLALETMIGVASVPLDDMPAEAAVARVQIGFAEMSKLRNRALSTPENVLDVGDIMRTSEWMIEAAAGLEARRKRSLDWSRCTPEERETLLRAKAIQDRLLNEI
jgi:hypothetical protein